MRPGRNGGKLKTGGNNGGGRPPKLPQIDVLLADILGEEKDGKTAAQAILAALRAKAAKGDIRAAEVLLDRAYGKPKQKLDIDAELRAETPIINVVVKPPSENVGK